MVSRAVISMACLLATLAGCATSSSDKPPLLPELDPRLIDDYNAAGILPYSRQDGEIVLLLGYEVRADVCRDCYFWTDFVGGRDPNDKSAIETALREFHEESRRIFTTSSLQRLMTSESLHSVGPVRIFLIEIEHVEAEKILKRKESSRTEKEGYCWVKLAPLLEAIDKSPRSAMDPEHCGQEVTRKVYPRFRQNLEADGALRDSLDRLLKAP